MCWSDNPARERNYGMEQERMQWTSRSGPGIGLIVKLLTDHRQALLELCLVKRADLLRRVYTHTHTYTKGKQLTVNGCLLICLFKKKSNPCLHMRPYCCAIHVPEFTTESGWSWVLFAMHLPCSCFSHSSFPESTPSGNHLHSISL
jgi:hypothetical protein